MSLEEINQEIDILTEKLKRGELQTSEEFKHLYDLIGKSMELTVGVSTDHNPCSVEIVTETVIKMANVIKPCKLLNVGMGGYPLVDIRLAKMGFDVTGVEYSEPLVHLAKNAIEKAGVSVECLVGDGMNLSFEDESFEACLSSETIEHIPDDKKVVKEIHRILKPGGYFLMTVPCILSLHSLHQKVFDFLAGRRLISHPSHLREYTYSSAKKLIAPYFEIEKWVAVPFTVASFNQMPVEYTLGQIVQLPILKHFSLSMAFILKKRGES